MVKSRAGAGSGIVFKAGAADKLELASAQLEDNASDLAYLDAQIRAQQAFAQLEDAIQRPLAAVTALEQGRTPQPGEE